jgi:hypothetical protein
VVPSWQEWMPRQLQLMCCVLCLAPVLFVRRVQGLDEVVDRVTVLSQLVADGQDNLAQQWAISLGRDYQVSYSCCVRVAVER